MSSHAPVAAVATAGQGEGEVASPRAYRKLLRAASSYASFQLPNVVERASWCRTGRPLVCMGIMASCALLLLVEIAVNDWEFEPFSVNPTFGPSVETLLKLGAKRTDLILDGDWYRLIAPIFLHGGLIHFTFNMLGLWSIGFPLERQFGSLALGYIFFIGGFMGVIISAIFSPRVVGVGASGGIFAIFGSAWSELFLNWSLYQGEGWKSLLQLLLATAFNMILGLMPFLDNFAHLGGFFSGFVCGFGVLVSNRYTRNGELKDRKTYQVVLQVISVVLTPIMVVVGLFVLYFGVGGGSDANEWCEWCRYLTCVPFPPGVPDESKWWLCDACADGGINAEVFANLTAIIDCPQDGPRLVVQLPPGTDLNDGTAFIQACRQVC